MDLQCPSPPAVALHALEYVPNAQRPQASVNGIVGYCKLCSAEMKKDPTSMAALMTGHGALLWLSDAAHPARQALKSRLVAEPAVVRVLEHSLGHPTMMELRVMALDVAEFLSRTKVDRPPLYCLIPTAARWVAKPARPARAVGPVMAAITAEGQTLEQAIQVAACSLLTNLLDSHANREMAMAEAPTLLRACTALLEAGPGTTAAARDLYENAFTVLSSFIQHPQHQAAMAELLADHACTLVMRDAGPFNAPYLEMGSSQSVYRSLKCLTNITNPALVRGEGAMQRVLAAGVPARLQQLLPHPILGPEARNVITNLSGAAPHVFLNLASSGSNKAARGPTSGGAGGSGAAGGSAGAADAAVRAQLSALDVGAPCFNVEDAVFAMTTCSNLLTAAPTTYAKAMVSAGVPEAMLAACDRIVDAPALEEFRALSDNAAAMSNVAQTCMRFLMESMLHGVLSMVPQQGDIKQQPLVVDLRRRLIPRLRKFLLHPDRVVRTMAASACFSLGCLTHDMPQRLGDLPANSVQARVLARLMDIEQTRVLQGGGLWDMPPGAVMDMRLPPFVDWDELRMCDGCGRHNHFRGETRQPPIKLRRCGGCRQRRYCSAECAKLAWKAHKENCKWMQHEQELRRAAQGGERSQQQPEQPQQLPGGEAAGDTDFETWPVRRLKEYLAGRGVDYSRCIEKVHLVELCKQAQ